MFTQSLYIFAVTMSYLILKARVAVMITHGPTKRMTAARGWWMNSTVNVLKHGVITSTCAVGK